MVYLLVGSHIAAGIGAVLVYRNNQEKIEKLISKVSDFIKKVIGKFKKS